MITAQNRGKRGEVGSAIFIQERSMNVTNVATACVLGLIGGLIGCAGQSDTVYQVSTIDSLLAAQYGPQQSLAELRDHGDFGIGTFEHLDGEMLVLDGDVYQVASTGKVARMKDDVMTPFATVKFFQTDQMFEISEGVDLAGMGAWIDKLLPTANWFYAIRIDGEFEFVRTRSVPRQEPPYVPLVEVVKTQPVWTFEKVSGTLVGFRCPDYSRGLNVPGYHWHFLTKDRDAGGHVQDLRIKSVRVRVDHAREWRVWLPEDEGFRMLDLGRNRAQELHKVEK